MLTDSELAAMRDTATSAMPDTVKIVRPPSGGNLDLDTGEWMPNLPSTIYSGVARVRPPNTTEREVLFGDIQVTTQRFVGTFPYNVADIAVDDIVTVTVSSDPNIAGRYFRVVGHGAGSWHIARRVALETVEE